MMQLLHTYPGLLVDLLDMSAARPRGQRRWKPCQRSPTAAEPTESLAACQDVAMLVTLTPGVDRNRVLELLRQASVEIMNKHGDQDGYVRWVMNTARMLRGQIAQTDLDQLLLTPAFYRLVDPVMMGTPQGLWLLEAEMSDRQALFTAAFETLQKQLGTWTAEAGKVLAVLDASVFLSHPAWTQDDDPAAVIASIPWAEELGLGF
jgi:hypothetical protein